MTTFAPCAACRRHVRTDESACPFCGHAHDAAMRAVSAPTEPPRVSRALLALAASVGLAASACPNSPPAPVYGGPPSPMPVAAPDATPAPTETAAPTDAASTADAAPMPAPTPSPTPTTPTQPTGTQGPYPQPGPPPQPPPQPPHHAPKPLYGAPPTIH